MQSIGELFLIKMMTTIMVIIILLATGYISGRDTLRFACIISQKPCNKPKDKQHSHFKDETKHAKELYVTTIK